jgi:hypothetical protein
MAYIPKNKIKSNLYTQGGEFIYVSNNEGYAGDYHELYNGKFFTGKTPNSANIKELKRSTPIQPTNAPTSLLSDPPPPNTSLPLLPTSQDYKNGEFVRYFICRRNQPLFVEINKATFTQYVQKDSTVSWRLYKPFSLFWVLTGDINQVAQTNKNVTEFTEQKEKVEGLSVYLKEDWTQYYKSNP